jgi:phosphoglycolate phosphatase
MNTDTEPKAATDTNPGDGPAAWRGRPIQAVLFDLDGTLLDTAGDIALALNRAIAEFGWPEVPAAEVRHMIGRGSPILIERVARAQRRELDPATQSAMVERFFHYYGELEETGECAATAFDGGADALRALHSAGLRIAVVTNKQRRFATALLKLLKLDAWIDLVVGGDSCERRKPDPQPLLFACESLGVPPTRALMVGDSTNDVQAARAAGIPVLCVLHGYNEGQDPRTLPCDAHLEHLGLLPDMLLPAGRDAATGLIRTDS